MARQEVTFYIRARDMTRGVFRRVRRSINALGRAASGVRGLVAGALGAGLAAAANQAGKFAQAIETASTRVNTSVEEMQGWKVAAESYGEDLQGVTDLMIELRRRAQEATRGDVAMAERFQELGFSIAELEELNGPQILRRIGESVRRMGAGNVRFDLLDAIGGEDLTRAVPGLLRNMSREVDKYARESAMSVDEIREDAQRQRELQASLAELQAESNRLLGELVPVMTEGVRMLTDLIELGRKLSGTEGDLAQADVAREMVDRVPGLRSIAQATEDANVGAVMFDLVQAMRENTAEQKKAGAESAVLGP